MPSSKLLASSLTVIWIVLFSLKRPAGQSQVKIRAVGKRAGSICGSASQLTLLLQSLGSTQVHVSGDFVSRPCMAMMSIPMSVSVSASFLLVLTWQRRTPSQADRAWSEVGRAGAGLEFVSGGFVPRPWMMSMSMSASFFSWLTCWVRTPCSVDRAGSEVGPAGDGGAGLECAGAEYNQRQTAIVPTRRQKAVVRPAKVMELTEDMVWSLAELRGQDRESHKLPRRRCCDSVHIGKAVPRRRMLRAFCG